MKNISCKKITARTVLVFLAAYPVSLIIWIQVKDEYGYATTVIASKLAAGLKDARVEEISSASAAI